MSRSFFSDSWHRVAGLKPRLLAHVRIHRQELRAGTCHVIEDTHRGRFHVISGPGIRLLPLLDGTRSADEIWRAAAADQGREAPSQDDLLRLLCQLQDAGVLGCGNASDADDLERREARERGAAARSLLRPLFWRIRLVDPHRLLVRLDGVARRIFSGTGFAVWLAAVSLGAVLALGNREELAESIEDRLRAPGSLLLLWGVFLGLKLLHELGHGLAVRAFGGAVREAGIAILVVTPVPYIDASSASAFPRRIHRIAVGAAGMMVELFIASLALAGWAALEPSTLRALLRDVVLTAGLSTVLFNANPLIKLDGYYILCDALGVPNLQARASRYLSALAERLLGCRDVVFHDASRTERALLALYGIASAACRIAILCAVILFVAGRYRHAGVLLAVWGAAAWGLWPLARGVRFLLASPRLVHARERALAVTAMGLLLAIGGLCLVPLPSSTVAEGVIVLDEAGMVTAGTDAFIREVLAVPGRRVARGDVLLAGDDPELAARIEVLAGELEELRARRDQSLPGDPVRAQMVDEEIGRRGVALAADLERREALTIRSRGDGIFIVPCPEDLPGRFVARGTPIAYVVSREAAHARVVLPQDAIARVREGTREVSLRLAGGPGGPWPTSIVREIPAATTRLPSPALGSLAGGDIPADPRDAEGSTSLEGTFQLDLELPDLGDPVPVGCRVLVRFDHDAEPLAPRILRGLRGLLQGLPAP